MKKLVLIIAIFSFSLSAAAQIANALTGTNEVMREKSIEGVEGSPYLFKNWYPGTITDNHGKIYSDLLIRYDIQKERVEFTDQGKVYEISTALYKSFTINVLNEDVQKIQKFIFTNDQTLPGFPKNSYSQILVDGKYTLIKKHKAVFLEENVTSYGSTVIKKRYQNSVHYFIMKDSQIKSIKLSKKAVLDSFPEFEDVLKSTKIREEGDLISLLIKMNDSSSITNDRSAN